MFFKYYLIGVVLILSSATASTCEGDKESYSDSNHLLCKRCGVRVAETRDVRNIRGKSAERTTIKQFSDKNVALVQDFTNPSNQKFGLITMSDAQLYVHDQVVVEDTWFAEHSWSPCTCPRCQAFLGWKYQPFTKSHAQQQRSDSQGCPGSNSDFYGIILDRLIEEKESNAFLLTPKSFGDTQ